MSLAFFYPRTTFQDAALLVNGPAKMTWLKNRPNRVFYIDKYWKDCFLLVFVSSPQFPSWSLNIFIDRIKKCSSESKKKESKHDHMISFNLLPCGRPRITWSSSCNIYLAFVGADYTVSPLHMLFTHLYKKFSAHSCALQRRSPLL